MTPPQNIEAERALLGSLLLDKEAIYNILDFIEPKDFYVLLHQNIYKAYLECFELNKQVDILVLSDHLSKNKEDVKKTELINIANSTITSFNVLEYAKIIKDKSLRRQILQAQETNTRDVLNEGIEINSVISQTQERIFAVSPLKKKTDNVKSVMSELENLQLAYSEKYESGKKIIGHSTGFGKIDNLVDGVQDGHFWVIGGWHGGGKTSFALNIVHNLLEQNVGVGIISLEMGKVAILGKLMGIRHEISCMKILKGIHEQDMAKKIKEAKLFFNQTNLEIHTEHNIDKIKMQIRKDYYTKNIKVFVIDYIQKIQHEKIFNETELMSKCSIGLANLCTELGIAILLISQISNEAQKGNGAGAGFKGSGTIEASADLALVLKRDRTTENPEAKNVPVTIHITKNKYGFDGTINSLFYLESGKYFIFDV